ncbi:hypothetical protein [Aquimarina spongiae]|uniref:Uncharacterized protein n=1 Tax=Aquimarina spongiae TaxID=570521 RepID=A0A1M6JEK0_9FLAO|nr:hypothetical protein [Aquimarina spongiae]SHJ45075.1 hypothetical protein SAMN04488508_10922 [Aquimarina spongiae]
MKKHIEKDTLWSKVTVASIGILTISLISIALDSQMILCSLGLLPNIIRSIE